MEYLSLFDLQQKIKDSLIGAFPLPTWIVAEIGEMKVNYAGHCYLDLVEKDGADGVKLRARVSANIWANRFRLIKMSFEAATSVAFESGLKVLVRADVRFHEVYGLSLNIVDIDPSYTIGEMKLQRGLTIQRLVDEGVIDLNRELLLASVPQRIAVVSSSSAAGLQDFINHLQGNQSGYCFSVELFSAVMQGNEAAASIISAFDRIYEREGDFDAVVIIRGGGAQTDLACFDSYDVAVNVAQFPLPVLSGIGHDKDESVVDIVAHRSFKTPTAVAGFLIDCMAEFEGEVDDAAGAIGRLAQRLIQNQKLATVEVEYDVLNRVRGLLKRHNRVLDEMSYSVSGRLLTQLSAQSRFVDGVSYRVQSVVQSRIQKAEMLLVQASREAEYLSKRGLAHVSKELDNLESRINASNPSEVLKRGYSLTLHRGLVVRTIEDLKGLEIETVVNDGRIKSTVTEIIPNTEDIWQKKS